MKGESMVETAKVKKFAGIEVASDLTKTNFFFLYLNTLFIGSNDDVGYWQERCIGCGDCVLDLTGGVCPRTRCSKGLMNGPCGGSENGRCEVDPDTIECGWRLIYDRLSSFGAIDNMMEIRPPRDWSKSHDGGPRSLTHRDIRS